MTGSRVLYSFILIFMSSSVFGQLYLDWAKQIGANKYDYVSDITTDTLGNVYSTGSFQNTVDFGSDSTIFVRTAIGGFDIFIQKHSPGGELLWVNTYGSGGNFEAGKGIVLDKEGNIFIAGDIGNTADTTIFVIDFNPGGQDGKLTTEDKDGYILKLDNNGNFKKIRQFNGPKFQYGHSIAINSVGQIAISAVFRDSLYLKDHGDDLTLSLSPGTDKNNNVALFKFTNNLDLIWSKVLDISAGDNHRNLCYDNKDNLLLLTQGEYGAANEHDDIIKFAPNGNKIWGKHFEGVISILSLNCDNQNNVLIGGWFRQIVDFDLGNSTYNLTATGTNTELFLQVLNEDGDFVFAKNLKGNGIATIRDINTDDEGFHYLSGSFKDTVDFNWGVAEELRHANENGEGFLLRLTNDFKFSSISTLEGNDNSSISVTSIFNNNIYVGGRFSRTTDFDFSNSVSNMSSVMDDPLGYNAYPDGFLLKLSKDSCTNFSLAIDSLVGNLSCENKLEMHMSCNSGYTPFIYKLDNSSYSSTPLFNIEFGGTKTIHAKDQFNCIDSSIVNIQGPIGNGFDVAIGGIVTNGFRRGFEDKNLITIINSRCKKTSFEFKMLLDSLTDYISSSPDIDHQNGDTLVWLIDSLNYDSKPTIIALKLYTNLNANIGDSVHLHSWVSPLNNDLNALNNTKDFVFPVINGYDPNDIKVSPLGRCNNHYIKNEEELTYTIRFQNTGNAEAVHIEVLDTLDTSFDITSFNLIATSHTVDLSIFQGEILKFRFDSIMLVDSTTNNDLSKGFIQYNIRLKSNSNNILVENKAHIYFDFNPPVITNTVFNNIVNDTPDCTPSLSINEKNVLQLKLFPVPTGNLLNYQSNTSFKSITIYDLSGKKILIKEQGTENSIDVSSFSNGLYFINFQTNLNERKTLKFVVKK